MQDKMIRNLILDICNTGRRGAAFSLKDRLLVLELLYYAWHLSSDYICVCNALDQFILYYNIFIIFIIFIVLCLLYYGIALNLY